MTTTQTHNSLNTHSAPFSLTGTTITASLSGVIADLVDPPELQQLIGGQWRSLNPQLRWLSTDKGGTKQAQAMPTAAGFRWSVPIGGHSVSTTVTST